MIKLRLIPDKTQIPFMEYRCITCIASSVLIALSIVGWLIYGFNFGIDFTGGTVVEARQKGGSNISHVRNLMSGAGFKEVHVQEFHGTDIVQLRISQNDKGSSNRLLSVAEIKSIFGDEFEIRNIEVIGPAISSELRRDAIIAVIVSILLVLVYLWFRFEWQYAVGAVLTTVHDVLLALGFMVYTGMTFNLPILAAILTIVGYSLNDTIVIYDRIRELMNNYKFIPLPEIINLSINQTLARTITTSITLLIAALTLLFLGGKSLYGFNVMIVLGVLVGTYSSVVISAPMLIVLKLHHIEKTHSLN